MNNGDMPAMAQTSSENLCQQTGAPNLIHMGLTKREYFAALAMQGLCAHYGIKKSNRDLAFASIAMADALLAELEKDGES